MALLTNCVSLLASGWLAYRLSCLNPAVRQRLFVRQLRALSVVDITIHSALLPIRTLTLLATDLKLVPDTAMAHKWLSRACYVSALPFETARDCMICVELHIAVSVLACSCRCTRVFAALPRVFSFWWLVLAGLICFRLSVIQHSSFNINRGVCLSELHTPHMLLALRYVGSLSICALAYISVLLSVYVLESPGVVQKRHLSRACWYLVSFTVCTFPLLGAKYFSFPLAPAIMLEGMRGFLDTVTYAAQSAYIKRSCGAVNTLAAQGAAEPVAGATQKAYRVCFGETRVVDFQNTSEDVLARIPSGSPLGADEEEGVLVATPDGCSERLRRFREGLASVLRC